MGNVIKDRDIKHLTKEKKKYLISEPNNHT